MSGFSQLLDQAQSKTKSFSASITSSLGGAFSDISRIVGGFVIGNVISAGLSKMQWMHVKREMRLCVDI